MKRGRPKHDDILTPREWQVLKLVREGLTNEAIADRLGISFAAAKYHVAEIMSKLGVGSRQEAVQRVDEETRGRWAALPVVAWLRRGGAARKAATLAFGGSAVVALLLLAGVLSFGGGSAVHFDTSALGLDEGSAAQQANDRAQNASPYKHTILLTKTTPQNVGDAAAIIASMRTVGSVAELKAALAMTRDVHLIVVDQSAAAELQGTDVLFQQRKQGKAIIEINVCLAQVHSDGDVFDPSPRPAGIVTEIDPNGVVRNIDVPANPEPGRERCVYVDRFQAAGYGYFTVRGAPNPDAQYPRPKAVGSDSGGKFAPGYFEIAVTLMDQEPTGDWLTDTCGTAKRLGLTDAAALVCAN